MAPWSGATASTITSPTRRTTRVDVVDAKTLKVTKRIPLSGKPNNLSIGLDGRRIYVALRQIPGGVDVIDTASATLAKTVPTEGDVHNTFVTPDGNTSWPARSATSGSR